MTLQFDLTIHDEAQASAAASEVLRTLLKNAESEGGRAETEGGQSPEVAMHGPSRNPEAAAVILASEVLALGAERIPWLDVSKIVGQSRTADA